MSERDEVREARTLSLADEIRYRMRHEIWEMSTMSGSREDNPWHKMLEDYYNNGKPIPFYRPYIPLQWVDLKELEKQDDTER